MQILYCSNAILKCKGMKKKKYILVGLFLVALVFSNLYNYIQFQKTCEAQAVLYKLKVEADVKLGRLGALEDYRTFEMLLNGTKIYADLSVVDMQYREKKIADIISDNTLILRYSEMNCDVCVDSIVKRLNAYKDSIGLSNIVLLTTSQNSGYIKRFRKINKISFSIYNMGEVLDSILIDIGMPYLFVYSSNNDRINNVFVPQRENQPLTNEYLHSILMKYYIN
jgi:hypothetical protein